MTDANTVREELRSWLADNWDPELSLREWRERLADSGWGCPTWPQEWGGRGLAPSFADVVGHEIAAYGAVGVPGGVGMTLAGPTLLEQGDDELKKRFIRPTITGDISWCQLFSEPAAGSDLAGLRTHAVRDGDEWVVNGQKVWNTSAHHADFGLLVARTDWDVPKHRGLTYFVLPMHQPGVEVRPLRQMNGHASFNEVFLADARVPADHVIGDVGGGWAVALTTLSHERRLASALRGVPVPPGESRVFREAREEWIKANEPYVWYPQRAGRADLVVRRAVETGRGNDPAVRQEVARAISLAWTTRWMAQRAAAARKAGKPPGPEGSLAKLAGSNVARACRRAHEEIESGSAMLGGRDGGLGGVIPEVILSVPAVSIAGGTDEIQHNIIAERVLGLPKEPQIDRDMPFREVPAGRT
ncbi:MAG TPA: acyl-CoA dehydrogenase family protein [Mycobacteriales bacterium]|nr:acyl-CoA dehydrogenase family protein [Mycobacteriales bacterium]